MAAYLGECETTRQRDILAVLTACAGQPAVCVQLVCLGQCMPHKRRQDPMRCDRNGGTDRSSKSSLFLSAQRVLGIVNAVSVVATFFLLLVPAGWHIPGERGLGTWTLIGAPVTSSMCLLWAYRSFRKGCGGTSWTRLHCAVLGAWCLLMLFIATAFVMAP